MPLSIPARALLQRLRPWLSKAVHVRWTLNRSFYQREADALLTALSSYQGRMPPRAAAGRGGSLGRPLREGFPATWRTQPTYAEVVRDFRWWLDSAERWSEPPKRTRRTTARAKRPTEPPSKQPARLLTILDLPRNCTRTQFLKAWRRFLKDNHPDLNPGQSLEERRRFAEAVALWRR